MSYNPRIPTDSIVSAWLDGVEHLIDSSDYELFNLILHIKKPKLLSECEKKIIRHVDDFLKENGISELRTVVNTIFPPSIAHGNSIDELTIKYKEMYENQLKSTGRWGTYFFRMIERKGQNGEKINQLKNIIHTLKEKRDDSRIFNCEIIISDPSSDIKRNRGRPCLSMIELNINNGHIDMVAIYRNHDYIGKALGNIIGLLELQNYISEQSDLNTGTLTILSTHATLKYDGGGITKIRKLIGECKNILNT